MDQNNSIIDIGKLAKPANTLIERISDAVGGIFKPYQIKRVARAEAEAEKIKAIANIEIDEFQQRALGRLLVEESLKQNNMENITLKSLPFLSPEAKPQNIENDWIVDFFDKSRLISDEEIQEIWARVLAGEANSPGTYKKRTIHLLASLDKEDAILFAKLCDFNWNIEGMTPLIFDSKNEIYTKNGINFSSLQHLDSIGLISFESLSGYLKKGFSKTEKVSYGGKTISLQFPNDKDNELPIGHVLFTNVGLQLANICTPNNIDGLPEYVLGKWTENQINELSKPTNNIISEDQKGVTA
jgi:hypothetical protein